MKRFVYPMAMSLLHHPGIGSGECTALAQYTLPGNSAPICPYHTSQWIRGEKVRGNRSLQRGTLIAIFHHGHYLSKYGGVAHTALYVGQSDEGIEVIHQSKGRLITGALIRFDNLKSPGHLSGVSRRNRHFNVVTPEDEGDNYYTVTIAHGAPSLEDFKVHVSGATAPNL
jgi:hypothetical protein